ncbi:lysine--tRNA ligase [Candidatus Aerophobetes bacterium]|uniref:Lysine--tRNA ligase n=1 Tax=Aerophobetes bacterium TaxID=2030807 RepID=A0A662D2E2_UNCAE|nr:MAG: lysine--tRNA ligase [Candidatus Aerophobetes bacterium]
MELPGERLIEERKNKLKEWIREEGNPYWEKFVPDHSTQQIREKYESLKAGEEIGLEVSLAGRIIARRGHGKASFIDVRDGLGRIQAYARKDILGERYSLFQKLDLGDIIGVRGRVFKTRTGELTINISDFTLLAKSLRHLPEKWHGLQDIELRYRKRYLDLLFNPEVKRSFLIRGAIIRCIRNFLDERGYLEVETPMMQPVPGGATARPFRTHHYALDKDFYLRIAPELYLKKLVVGGLEKVYELNRNFRNEGMDRFHNPEFTMLEIYSAYSDYKKMMNLSEELICETVRRVNGALKINYQGNEIDLSPPWRRMTFKAALKEIGGIKLDYENEKKLKKIASEAGLSVEDLSKSQILEHLLDKKVVPKLIQPTFILDYPEETSPLAKRKKDEPSLIERFEIFIGGGEIGNAYSELNDPIEQRERLMRAKADEGSLDEDFLEALEYGMPPTGGLGIGIDRLVMLLTNSSSIRDVILFPQMKPK